MNADHAALGPPTPAGSARRGLRDLLPYALGTLAGVHLLLLYAPWQFLLPAVNLESSFIQVLNHAAAARWQWGEHITFTYGPLGYVRVPVFDERLLGSVLAWNGLLVIALIGGVLDVLRRAPMPAAFAAYAIMAMAAGGPGAGAKGVYFLFPLLAALLHFQAPGRRARATTLLVVGAAGVHANAYLSTLPLGLAIVVLMDASRVRHRRVPVYALSWLGAFAATFLLAGQNLHALPTFLRGVAELVDGYPQAMSRAGSGIEATAFVAIGVAALLVAARCEHRRPDAEGRTDGWLMLAALCTFGYLAWKSGFVRQDAAHTVPAWRVAAAGFAAYAAARWTSAPSAMLRAAMIGAAAILCLSALAATGRPFVPEVADRARAVFADTPIEALRTGFRALTAPARWTEELRQSKEAAYARIRAVFPDLRASGTVDLVEIHQSALLAHGVDYRPQPVFQNFAAYTPALIDLNRHHLRDRGAARTIFVSTQTIDGRYPLSDLGPSIVELAGLYRPEDIADNHVRFTRRPVAVDRLATDAVGTESGLGDWIPVPEGSGAMLIAAGLRPSVLGRVASLAWRLPAANVTVRLADGSEETHRVVPAIAQSGFLLSPRLASAMELAAFGAGRLARLADRRVVAVRFDAARTTDRPFFETSVPVRMTRLDVPAANDDALAPALLAGFRREDAAATLARSVAGKGQNVRAVGATLLAHAPARPEIAVAEPSIVRMRYGIGEGAYTGDGRTDGVCFRIGARGGDGRVDVLHERCLLPRERPGDRAEQEATVLAGGAGPVALVLETDCRADCSSDWSYWKDIDIQRAPAHRGDVPGPGIGPDAIVAQLARSVAGKGQQVDARGALLFAHPPSSPHITLPAVRELRVTYGILARAWEEGRTDGVCFRVTASAASGERSRLLQRCLRPLDRRDDRGEQHASLPVRINGPVRLTFETECGGDCSWDWSYWKDIDARP